MLATAIIVFREVVEAALIIGIVLAASRGTPRRGWWVFGGVAMGLLAAGWVAAFADRLAAMAAGMGQELFNAAILFAAVLLLGWHNVWMQQHGRELAREMNQVGRAVAAGDRPLYALALVVGLAVLREGAEVVLFLFGVASAEPGQSWSMLTGGLLGIALGAGVGCALYSGLVKIPIRHLFAVTGWLILFLAAGLASQGAAYLVQADWLPPLGQSVWNTSDILSEDSIPGQVLHTLIGYAAEPDGVQILFYVVTLVTIYGLMRMFADHPRPPAAS